MTPTATDRAVKLIERAEGVIRTSEALKMGIHPRTLYELRDRGVLVQLSRGVYQLAERDSLSHPDFVIVAKRCPRAVVCLVSALAFHELTTQIPHEIAIALPQGSETPCIEHPPISVHRFSPESFAAGIERHKLDGVPVRIYSVEKTLADCFKFRNKIGMDVVLEALKLYQGRGRFDASALLHYARICRVKKVMTPYLEALI